jgi:uncharacterized protein (TIGR03000 family)
MAGIAGCWLVSAVLAQPGGPLTIPPDKALIIVRVAPDAMVMIGDFKSTQIGPERTFTTQSLQPGFTYSFEIIARWKDKDQERMAKRTVSFRPGEAKILDMTKEDKKKDSDKKKSDSDTKKSDSDKKKSDSDKKKSDSDTKKSDSDKKKSESDKKKSDSDTKKSDSDKKKSDSDKKVDPDKKGDTDKKVDPDKKGEARSRSFEFDYAGRVTGLPAGSIARVWLPMASSNGQQTVEVASQNIPASVQVTKDREYGNSILFFEGKANDRGELPFEVRYKVSRREVHTGSPGNLVVPQSPGENVQRFLQADAKVPISGKPLELLSAARADRPLPSDRREAARVLYDLVNKHLTYKKTGTGWGQGDAVWACDSRFGNCSDFHSLFIALARGNKIPAKFEMGFPIAAEPKGMVAGYHCWAWFMSDGKGWVPVDISEANRHPDRADYYFGNLTENRVSFSVGRDIELEPRQKGPPLNFFIDPYVEVDGKTYPAEMVQRTYSYMDVK